MWKTRKSRFFLYVDTSVIISPLIEEKMKNELKAVLFRKPRPLASDSLTGGAFVIYTTSDPYLET